jgi:hypothetical protein
LTGSWVCLYSAENGFIVVSRDELENYQILKIIVSCVNMQLYVAFAGQGKGSEQSTGHITMEFNSQHP